MKKRFVTTLLALIAAIACLIGLVACGDNADPVAGKTYVFEKAQITKGASGEEKALAEAWLNNLYAESTLSFDDETTYTMTMMGASNSSTYTQSGNKLTMNMAGEDLTAKVTSNSIKITMKNEGVESTLTYKAVVEDIGHITSPVDDVAGKTYVYDDAVLQFDDTVGYEERMQAEEALQSMKAAYQGATIVFDNNGGFTMTVGNSASGTYTQNGATLTLTANGTTLTYKVTGGAILSETKAAGIKTTTYFLLQED
ncbi:MAG: hypothetical protein HDP28_02995 [Clostridia bacterium]|nr:hypothetical protein [Clostridia bacterium]